MKNITVSKLTKKRARKAEKYWTKSKMKKAIPIPLKVAPPELLDLDSPDTGPTKIVAPTLPRSASRLRANTSEVSDMTLYPYRCVGKLFMREGSNNYVGSAWVIGRRAIFSAAHCLYDDGGSFFDNVVFHLQYRNGNSQGAFAVVQMAIDTRYLPSAGGNNDLRYDLGIGILDRPIDHLTGAAGYAINPTSQIALGNSVTGMGYPAGPPFDGSKMFQSKGQVVRDSSPGSTTERYFGAENDMTGGCSGGPWFDSSNIAVGLNSFVFIGENPPIMHSPYFGQGFADLINWADEKGGLDPEEPEDPPADEEEDSTAAKLRDVAKQLKKIADELEG